MVSEEIELNVALEKAGIEPVETDLGEYIIQLRHETPSHIVAPALHLTRQQIESDFPRSPQSPAAGPRSDGDPRSRRRSANHAAAEVYSRGCSPSKRARAPHRLHDRTRPSAAPLGFRDLGGGMTTAVGRLRPCNVLEWKFTVLSHNTIRGAAGAALLNAE